MSPYVAFEHPDGTFLVSTSDPGLGRPLFANRDRAEFRVLESALSFVEARGIVIDVGANIGTTAVSALVRHGYTRALCYEPEPENVAILRANIALNGLTGSAEVIEAAVSDTPGRACFGRGPTTRAGRRTGVGSLGRSGGGGAIEVEVVTIDDELGRLGIAPQDVGLLWIDAQGHEGHVLRGARRLLDGRRIPLVFALRPGKLSKAGGVEPLLEVTAGYEAFVDLRDPEQPKAPIAGLAGRVQRRPGTDILLF